MTIQRLSITAFFASTLLLAPACDKGEQSNADSGKTAQSDKPGGDADKPSDDDGAKLADADDQPAGADGGEEPAEDDEYAGFDDRVVRAAKMAQEIEEDPTAAETVLAENDMDREALDSLMFEIARDPDLTGQYRIARGL